MIYPFQTNNRNEYGLKDSVDCYRNINGMHFVNWTANSIEIEKEKIRAKKCGLKYRIIKGELYVEHEKNNEFFT